LSPASNPAMLVPHHVGEIFPARPRVNQAYDE
jgi:hypothetical protein